MVSYQFFVLRHKYDAAMTEDLIVACYELVSSYTYLSLKKSGMLIKIVDQ